MRWILDLDDTLAQTTRDMQGDTACVPFLTLAPGAAEFLARCQERKEKCVIVSIGEEGVQRAKIAHLGLSDIEATILPNGDAADLKLAAVKKIIDEGGAKEPWILVGDRPDRDIAVGNALGLITVRMRLPEGKYASLEPQTPVETPAYIVTDFFELMKLPLESALRK